MGDIVLNPSLRKSKHYLRHRTHMQFVPFDVYFHYIPKRTDRQTDRQTDTQTDRHTDRQTNQEKSQSRDPFK